MAKKITDTLVEKVEAQVKARTEGMGIEAIKAEVKKLAAARVRLAKLQKEHLVRYHKRAEIRREFNIAIKTMQAMLKDQKVEGVDEDDVLGFVDSGKVTQSAADAILAKLRARGFAA